MEGLNLPGKWSAKMWTQSWDVNAWQFCVNVAGHAWSFSNTPLVNTMTLICWCPLATCLFGVLLQHMQQCQWQRNTTNCVPHCPSQQMTLTLWVTTRRKERLLLGCKLALLQQSQAVLLNRRVCICSSRSNHNTAHPSSVVQKTRVYTSPLVCSYPCVYIYQILWQVPAVPRLAVPVRLLKANTAGRLVCHGVCCNPLSCLCFIESWWMIGMCDGSDVHMHSTLTAWCSNMSMTSTDSVRNNASVPSLAIAEHCQTHRTITIMKNRFFSIS